MSFKKIFMILFLFFFAFIVVKILLFILYPSTPKGFWEWWHRKDFEYAETISFKLGRVDIISSRLTCWEVLNDHCGVELIFSTSMPMEEFRSAITALNFDKRLDRNIDTMGFSTHLKLDAGKELRLDGVSGDFAKASTAWGYWLIDTKGKSFTVEFLTLPTSRVFLDDKPLAHNIIYLILYTKGR